MSDRGATISKERAIELGEIISEDVPELSVAIDQAVLLLSQNPRPTSVMVELWIEGER